MHKIYRCRNQINIKILLFTFLKKIHPLKITIYTVEELIRVL